MSRTLRPYQTKAIQEILAAWKTHQRVLYKLSTGGGKSFTMFSLIEYLLNYELDSYVIMAVKKRNLVFQLEEDAKDFGLEYGVTMAGEVRNDKRVQICSIDTLVSRADYPHSGKSNVYLFVDEADESNNESYNNFRDAYPNAKELGVTATPFNALPMYGAVIETITAKQLIKDKVLTPVRYIVPKKRIDSLTISITGGEFNNEEIDKATVIGDIVENWLLYGDNRQTMVFANNVKKSKEICQAFQDAGITAVHCDANTPEENRRTAISLFKRGEVKILCNVKLFTRGTNIIEIGAMIDAGPTTRLNLYLQKIGRGVRANPFYDDLIYIDHAGNCLNHGEFDEDREVNLSAGVKFTRANLIEKMRICKKCFRGFPPRDTCPFCGNDCKVIKKFKTKNLDGKMVEVTSEEFAKIKMIKFFNKHNGVYKHFKHYKNPENRGKPHICTLEWFGLAECLKVKEEIKLKKWHVIRWAKNSGRGFIDLSRSGLE